jgi:hypothetical protein
MSAGIGADAHSHSMAPRAAIRILNESVTQGLETNADADASPAEAATTEASPTDAHTKAGTWRIVAGSIIVRLCGNASRHSDR